MRPVVSALGSAVSPETNIICVGETLASARTVREIDSLRALPYESGATRRVIQASDI